MHISLDGFVAGPHGELNWVQLDQQLFDHVGQRIGKTGAALYGRVTYQMMENYWPEADKRPSATKHDIEHSQWYNNVHKVVLSRTIRTGNLSNTTIISNNLTDSINEIKNTSYEGSDDILLFGSPTATHALQQHGLIDGYWLFVNPVILGQGIPLFTDIKEKVKLNLLNTQQFASGVTELNYMLDR